MSHWQSFYSCATQNAANYSSIQQFYNFLKTYPWSIFLSRPNIVISICWFVHSMVSKIRQVEFTQSFHKVWQGGIQGNHCLWYIFNHVIYCIYANYYKTHNSICWWILIIVYLQFHSCKKIICFSQALTEMSESCKTFLWLKIKAVFKSWNSVNMYIVVYIKN